MKYMNNSIDLLYNWSIQAGSNVADIDGLVSVPKNLALLSIFQMMRDPSVPKGDS